VEELKMRLKWIYLFPVFIILIFCILPVSNYAVQDMENPCFFCHADLFFELQDGAHERNGLDCSSCHGESKEHNNAEDNSIKPDKLIKKSDAAEFCGGCHDTELKDYSQSTHAKSMGKIENTPTCTDCHIGHQFEKKIDHEKCLECHGGLKDSDHPVTEISVSEIVLYQAHSLMKTGNN